MTHPLIGALVYALGVAIGEAISVLALDFEPTAFDVVLIAFFTYLYACWRGQIEEAVRP